MNFFKEKAAIYVTAFMAVVCSMAVFIAIKVTIMAVDRQEQEIRNIPPAVNDSYEVSSKSVNISRLNEETLFFNGKKADNISAYYSDKKDVMLPIDQIFNSIGLKFTYYSSDDIFSSEIDGKKLIIKLGKDKFMYGEREISLSCVPLAAREHILVPAELFSHLDRFSVNNLISRNITFLDYYGNSQVFANLTAGILKTSKGTGGIWSFPEDSVLWNRKGNFQTEEYFEASPDGTKYILKSGRKVYMINPEKSPEPYIINASFWCGWSADSKYLYWEEAGGNPVIYDVDRNVVYKPDNNLWRAESMDGFEGFSKGRRELVEYVEAGGYRRISLKNVSLNKVYTIIQENGRILAEGEIKLSPDNTRILFKGSDGSFKFSGQDGSDIVNLGGAVNANWVTNSKIMLDMGYEKTLYDIKENNKVVTNLMWKKLGQAGDGSVFYTDGSIVYAETGGMDLQLLSLLWECDSIIANSVEGPYIILSKKGDRVFYANKGAITTIGRYGNMLRGEATSKDNFNYELNKSITASPSKETFMIAQKDDGLLILEFLGQRFVKRERIVLDYMTRDIPLADNINVKWASENNIILYTDNNIWFINIENGIEIYRMSETGGAAIEGVLLSNNIN